jgi:hypothetical protein
MLKYFHRLHYRLATLTHGVEGESGNIDIPSAASISTLVSSRAGEGVACCTAISSVRATLSFG